ncbi:MAG: tetratricopeptide repeat protein, partial [Pseudomonadota bacterium]
TTGALSDKDGQPLGLRNKSKAVLTFLLARPSRTVAKAEILDHVWTDVLASDESLVQCIADIRRLLGPDARRILETIPREGYRLNLAPVAPAPAPRPWRGAALLAVSTIAAGLFGIAVALGLFSPATEPGPVAVSGEASQAGSSPVISSAPPGTQSTEAYLEVLQGRVSASRYGRDESLAAERHFRRAIALDPNYARAHAELGTVLAVRFENDWNVLDDADRDKALFYAERALELDPDLWLAHYALGRLHSLLEDFDTAEAHLNTAMSLQPENEDARAYLAVVQIFRGQPEAAIEILEAVIPAHPDPPFWYHFSLGHALYNAARYEAAEGPLLACLEEAGTSPYCLRYLIATYGQLDRTGQAMEARRAYAALGLESGIGPMLSLVEFHHPEDIARLRDGLRRAEVPE